MGNVFSQEGQERDSELFLGSGQQFVQLEVSRLPYPLPCEDAGSPCPDGATSQRSCADADSAFTSALAGLIAGFTNIIVTFPINKVNVSLTMFSTKIGSFH